MTNASVTTPATQHENENSTPTSDVNQITIRESSEVSSSNCVSKSPVIEALSSFFKERRRLKEEAA